MTLQDLKNRYKVTKYENSYLLTDITARGKFFGSKYLGQIFKAGKKFAVKGFEPTDNLDTLIANLKEYEDSLPFNIECYYPLLSKGNFEELAVVDHMQKKGFESNGDLFIQFRKEIENVYGKKSSIVISISNLDSLECDPDKPVVIYYHVEDYTRVAVSCERDPVKIIEMIETILVTNAYGEIAEHLKLIEGMKSNPEILSSINKIKLQGVRVTEEPFKEQLKKALLKIAESL